VVDLQACTTFDEVCMLAHKVKQHKIARQPPKPQNPKPYTWNQTFNKRSSNPIFKPQNPPPSFPQRTPTPEKIQNPQNRPNTNPRATEDASNVKDLGV